ncbi:HEAT repeat domain-containing protein [Bryobacter aggregatus]|uniref:HEAT repeat domain-containing protein n=1 Tax=Bryobacter aggregatus TaxID=360054 RepID=UPI0004E1A32C|nr:HEAT repeat domain-containing protein [Bryobacter aggregatus]
MRQSQRFRLSPGTAALLSELGPKPAPPRFWRSNARVLDLLTQVGESNDAAAIGEILAFGLAAEDEIRSAARFAIGKLFALLPLEALPQLDDLLRHRWSNLNDWHDLSPEPGAADWTLPEDRLFLALLSCHSNGFIREKALWQMNEDPSESTLPFLMLRLVDWVPAVRHAAAIAFARKCTASYSQPIVNCLGLLDLLSHSSRYPLSLDTSIEALLHAPECAAALRAGCHAASRRVRARSFHCAVDNPAIATDQLYRTASSDRDSGIRSWAFQNCSVLHHEAAQDPFGPIRRIAFEAFRAESPASREQLRPFLFDVSASIRRDCQALFADAAAVYRAAIGQDSRHTAIAIRGLVETGDRSDAALILSKIGHPLARVRQAVVVAIQAFGLEDQHEVLLRLVTTDRPLVAREAARTLLRGVERPAETVWAAVRMHPDPRVSRTVITLFRGIGKWRQLAIYLDAVAAEDLILADSATKLLMAWFGAYNKSFEQPDAAAVVLLQERLEQLNSHLPAPLLRELRSILAGV